MALVSRGGAVYLRGTATATPTGTGSNPWGFTAAQLGAGFQSASTLGQQYPQFHEAPKQYLASNLTQSRSDAGNYGMLGSLFGSQTRQALDTPIQHAGVPTAGSVTGGTGNGITEIDYSVSIDYALGEKQATMGTPQYFRKLYRDQAPWDAQANAAAMAPGTYLGDLSPAANQLYKSTQLQARAAASPFGDNGPSTSVVKQMQTPTAAASNAINYGYSSTVTAGYGSTPSGDVDPRVRALDSLRSNESYLGTGTGDFQTTHYTISNQPSAAYQGTNAVPYPTAAPRMWGY